MIRPTTPDDTAAILALAVSSGLFPPDATDEVAAVLSGCLAGENGPDHVWLTDDDDGPVGVAYYAPERMTDGTWNLYMLAVHPDCQRQGRGAALVRNVEAALAAQADSSILELPRGMPYASVVHGAAGMHVLFVIHPRKNDWVLNAVSLAAPQRGLRQPLPAAWAGLEFAGLAEATGVPDAIFCHRNLFIAVAGSRDGVFELARKALETEG